MAEHSIQYFSHEQIDKTKWDRCIDEAPNGLIYAYSFYLDNMSKHWDALVLGDYEMIMPLTWNKKYGIYYLYQPAYTASLGVFGKNITTGVVKEFIAALPRKFKLIEIELNKANQLTEAGVVMRVNYVLDLNKPYESLYSNYRENIQRNIKKSQQLQCIYRTNVPVEEVIELSRQQMQRISNLTEEDYNRFGKLYDLLYSRGQALSCGVYSNAGQLIASCVYFFSHKRAYYIMVGNHPDGRTLGASHYLIDRFIYDNAGKDLLLDFEGSDIRNLAFFYSSFGANTESYSSLRINRLPWWAKLFK